MARKRGLSEGGMAVSPCVACGGARWVFMIQTLQPQRSSEEQEPQHTKLMPRCFEYRKVEGVNQELFELFILAEVTVPFLLTGPLTIQQETHPCTTTAILSGSATTAKLKHLV